MIAKRLLMAAAVLGALAAPSAAGASSDYPPSGAVVVISGEIVVDETVRVTVHNCAIGERIRTSLESSPAVTSVCDSGAVGLVETPARRPGVSQHPLRLPREPGIVTGTVELMESGETLAFFLDVQPREATSVLEPVTVATPSTGSIPGWPFLLLAALIVVLVILAAARDRREPETP